MSKPSYIPARLKRGKTWYITFYATDPIDGIRYRHRETYDLNRIPKISERLKLARSIVEDINEKLPTGFPYTEKTGRMEWQQKTICEVVKIGMEYTNMTGKKKSKQTRASDYNVFEKWIYAAGYSDMKVYKFTRRHAVEYLDYRIMVDKISATKRNGNLMRCRQFWKELTKREIFVHNPWNDIADLKEESKTRRFLSEEEQRAILAMSKKENYGLLMCIRYLWYCGLRNGEIQKLKVKYHDLKRGLIYMPGTATKTGERATIPIPPVFLEYLRESGIEKVNPDYYVCGKQLLPSKFMCGSNEMNRQHRIMMEKCISAGSMDSISGLSFYKWKNTAGKFLIDSNVPITDVKKYWRHKDINTTYGYFQDFSVENPNVDKSLDRLI